jgi:multiple sugar transport system substrate-binding protein
MVDQGVIKKNVAEVKTPDTVNEFKAGQVVFAINWGFAWDRFKDDKPTAGQGQGRRDAAAGDGRRQERHLHRRLAVGGQRLQQEQGRSRQAGASTWPAPRPASSWPPKARCCRPTPAVYTDADVVKAVPWFKDAAAVVGRQEPADERVRYGEVSDTIRTTTSAVLARTKTPADGVAEIEPPAPRDALNRWRAAQRVRHALHNIEGVLTSPCQGEGVA